MGRLMQQLPTPCGCAGDCGCDGVGMWESTGPVRIYLSDGTAGTAGHLYYTTARENLQPTELTIGGAGSDPQMKWVDLGEAVTGSAALFARALAYAQLPGVDLDMSTVMGLAAQAQADADDASREAADANIVATRVEVDLRDITAQLTTGIANLQSELQATMQVASDAMQESLYVQGRVDADIAQRDGRMDQIETQVADAQALIAEAEQDISEITLNRLPYVTQRAEAAAQSAAGIEGRIVVLESGMKALLDSFQTALNPMLPAWDPIKPYFPGATVRGRDNKVYVAVRDALGIDPVGDVTQTWELFDLDTFLQLSLSMIQPGVGATPMTSSMTDAIEAALHDATDSLIKVTTLATQVQTLTGTLGSLLPPGTAAWDATTHYAAGAMALHNGRLWVAEQPTHGQVPGAYTPWHEFTLNTGSATTPAPAEDVKASFHLSDGTDGGVEGYLYVTTTTPAPAFNPRVVGTRPGRGWWPLGRVAGSDGVQGPAGPQGIQGPAGPTGPAGRDGTAVAFKSILDANNPPPSAPTRGELFIAGSSQPKGGWPGQLSPAVGNGLLFDGATWLDVGPLRGPDGPVGPAGPAGPQGPQGVPGAVGATGAMGPQGAEGPTGATGPAGPSGRDGLPGADGADAFVDVHLGDGTRGEVGHLYVTTDPAAGMFPPNTTFSGHAAPAGWHDLGLVMGPPGRQGPQGVRGPAVTLALGTGKFGSVRGMLYYTAQEPAPAFDAANFASYRPIGTIGPRTFASDIKVATGVESIVTHGLGTRDVIVQLQGGGLVIFDAMIRIVDDNTVGVTVQVGGPYRIQVYRAL